MSSPGIALKLFLLPETLSVCRLPPAAPIPDWAKKGGFSSITRTSDELSIGCEERQVPSEEKCEPGWRALKIDGLLDFGLTGILASVANPLAKAGVSIFAVSTFNTDYVLIKEKMRPKAIQALEGAGHQIINV
jgi:hypothetical protein